ncbi:NAD(P)H-binding protein [uncultured Algoriphagus sp.]|uniref:NAD(P)H-binding protein n=1 Tax=uncultured Algoriphagus sp. TaxID=417365 RepID=UPI0030EDD4B2|tara:strand:- start:14856 stop:15434 length:579 start_codon:yes stop_codon:yes gene_type:complete
MKNVLILGASGTIARHVYDLLINNSSIQLTLFLRNARRLRKNNVARAQIIEGDVLNYTQLKEAMFGQEIVYVNLAGELGNMVKNIVRAMEETQLKRIIFISSIGIYDVPMKSVLEQYRKASDIIESSELDYTILRPAWFTATDEVDYEITTKGEPEKGSVISQRSLATFISKLIEDPQINVRQNLGINKPNS